VCSTVLSMQPISIVYGDKHDAPPIGYESFEGD